jgi:hypothetical protein
VQISTTDSRDKYFVQTAAARVVTTKAREEAEFFRKWEASAAQRFPQALD